MDRRPYSTRLVTVRQRCLRLRGDALGWVSLLQVSFYIYIRLDDGNQSALECFAARWFLETLSLTRWCRQNRGSIVSKPGLDRERKTGMGMNDINQSKSPVGGRRFPGRSWALIALACFGLVAGCAQVRKATYPGDFVYLHPQQVKSEMALLALYMRQIDEILRDGTTISSEQQQNLFKILVKIDDTTNRLGAGNIETSHLIIDDHIDQFKADVTIAMRDASADPPNYYTLGKLAGSCVACHQYR